mmetsp:Transcript_35950/g.81153  ORF Transcript_35950/g.81153 Transcript_35950/m.81153 type:complete len:277 (-) Transcript_35950:560-1390(-)
MSACTAAHRWPTTARTRPWPSLSGRWWSGSTLARRGSLARGARRPLVLVLFPPAGTGAAAWTRRTGTTRACASPGSRGRSARWRRMSATVSPVCMALAGTRLGASFVTAPALDSLASDARRISMSAKRMAVFACTVASAWTPTDPTGVIASQASQGERAPSGWTTASTTPAKAMPPASPPVTPTGASAPPAAPGTGARCRSMSVRTPPAGTVASATTPQMGSRASASGRRGGGGARRWWTCAGPCGRAGTGGRAGTWRRMGLSVRVRWGGLGGSVT